MAKRKSAKIGKKSSTKDMKGMKKKRKRLDKKAESPDKEAESRHDENKLQKLSLRGNSTTEKIQNLHHGLEEEITLENGSDVTKKDLSKTEKDEIDVGGPIISSSAMESYVHLIDKEAPNENPRHCIDDNMGCKEVKIQMNEDKDHTTSLLLFYQYIDPQWSDSLFKKVLAFVEGMGKKYNITGRMRVAYEGLNCTLTGTYSNLRRWCRALREYEDGKYFSKTEFKITDHLPKHQCFPKLHAFKVDELVNYGLAGHLTPSITKTGKHLEPEDYHLKMAEKDTVIIDVRNHYESLIGHFSPPNNGAKYIDPNMRKSTEFPVWLDKPETKEMLRNKQVLMYCTGGVRCERASALLQTKIENEEDVKKLGIKGIYQLQGGIDKYFKKFPDGGWWKGKNYVFDKRNAHAPPIIEALENEARKVTKNEGEYSTTGGKLQIGSLTNPSIVPVIGMCEACKKPWDRYKSKRRCPTCGVPSLICKECAGELKIKGKSLGSTIRCDLCVNQGITSKQQIKEKEIKELEDYRRERKVDMMAGKDNEDKRNDKISVDKTRKVLESTITDSRASVFDESNRLIIKNMCIQNMTEDKLRKLVIGISHIHWLKDKTTKEWYGAAFVYMASKEDASNAVKNINGKVIFGRRMNIMYAKPKLNEKLKI